MAPSRPLPTPTPRPRHHRRTTARQPVLTPANTSNRSKTAGLRLHEAFTPSLAVAQPEHDQGVIHRHESYPQPHARPRRATVSTGKLRRSARPPPGCWPRPRAGGAAPAAGHRPPVPAPTSRRGDRLPSFQQQTNTSGLDPFPVSRITGRPLTPRVAQMKPSEPVLGPSLVGLMHSRDLRSGGHADGGECAQR